MAHTFSYRSIARTLQVRLTKGDDIDALHTLDQKDWLMLACPVQGLGAGETIARLLDTDQDGRINVTDILSAIDWLRSRLASFDLLFTPSQHLLASDIAPATEAGQRLANLYQRIAPTTPLTIATIDSAIKDFLAQPQNGDGVIAPTDLDARIQPLAHAILALTGGAPAMNGTQGINQATLTTFLAARDTTFAWKAAAPQSAAFPNHLNPETTSAAIQSIATKIDAYFTACDMVRYNPAAQKTFEAPTQLSDLALAPICLPDPQAYTLDFDHGINPNDLPAMGQLKALALALQPDAETLDLPLWQRIKATIAPYNAWTSAQPAHLAFFNALSAEQTTLLHDPTAIAAIEQAIAQDAAQAPLAAALDDLRRLLILRTDLLRLLRNFVNIEDLYPPTSRALFQVGTLYMDGRSCTLCFPINQAAAAHAAAAKDAACCLAYCTLSRPSEGKTQTICAVFTAGTASTLSTGRNGLFYDLQGTPWHATITHLLSASMSLCEAFFSPWRKMADAFKNTLLKFISSKNDAAMTTMSAHAESSATALTTGKPTPPASDPSASMASIATLGIALSFFATALTGILTALTSAPLWKTGSIVLGLICLVSLPNVLLTWLKLRARDLAAILNASGWAVNRRIGLTPRLGRAFTQQSHLNHKRRNLLLRLLILLILCAGLLWYIFCPTSPRQKRENTPPPPPTATENGAAAAPPHAVPGEAEHQPKTENRGVAAN